MMVGGGSSGGGGSGGGGDGEGEFPRRDERVPQWGLQETRDFIRIRAELERDFTVSKRNKKTLWESVSVRMKEEFGYRRTADQCKSKWKNLITRYKGKETTDQDGGRQFPFFDELHAIFTEREIQMQQMLLDFETGDVQPKKKIKRSVDQFSEYLSDFEIEDEERRNQDVTNIVSPRKRKSEKEKEQKRVDTASGQYGSGSLSIQDMLKEFLQQQERIEMMWKETMEKHAHERQVFEQEWRHSMEKIERERLIAEQAWREREEQRRMRDESRAEKRDALLTMLWNKLIHETHHP